MSSPDRAAPLEASAEPVREPTATLLAQGQGKCRATPHPPLPDACQSAGAAQQAGAPKHGTSALVPVEGGKWG